MPRNKNGEPYSIIDGNCEMYIGSSGTKYWYLKDTTIRHRENGPAIEKIDGNKSWYLNDVEYSKEDYDIMIEMKVFW
jgi:hypothetical protein